MANVRRDLLSRRPIPERAARLPRASHVLIHVIGGGAWLTGGLWLAVHHLLQRPGEFGPRPHPLEPWLLPAHAAFAMAGVWLLGVLASLHLPVAWRTRRRRWSGGLLVGAALSLVVSGYLLYYAGSDDVRTVVAVLHWSVGLATPLAYAAHRAVRRRLRRVAA